jgi:hypothetical protein
VTDYASCVRACVHRATRRHTMQWFQLTIDLLMLACAMLSLAIAVV